MSEILVTYFSATGVTRTIATQLANNLNSDIQEITPLIKYSSQDLNWNSKTSRTSIEGRDFKIRPLISNTFKIKNYDTIYLGFPIWWYRAPNIINTFIESYDFSNKRVILFATSGGSGFDKTTLYIKQSLPHSTKLVEGVVFTHGIDELSLKKLQDLSESM